MAESLEVKGSRKVRTVGTQQVATTLWVTDDGYTSAPQVGADYVPDVTTYAADPLKRRKCFNVTVDPEVIPGVFFVTAQYRAFLSYT
jgi:hypothetical protein